MEINTAGTMRLYPINRGNKVLGVTHSSGRCMISFIGSFIKTKRNRKWIKSQNNHHRSTKPQCTETSFFLSIEACRDRANLVNTMINIISHQNVKKSTYRFQLKYKMPIKAIVLMSTAIHSERRTIDIHY